MEPSEDDDAEFVSGVFHFDPPESEWSDRDVCDFIELMITGSCPSRPRRTCAKQFEKYRREEWPANRHAGKSGCKEVHMQDLRQC